MTEPTRRYLLAGFGQALGAGLLLKTLAAPVTAAVPAAIAAPIPRLLARFWIAGFQHYQKPGYLAACAVDQPLELIAEPGNRYDARAVVVNHRGAKIGYVPQDENATFADLLSRGENLTAKISRIDLADAWQPLQIAVYF